MFRKEKECFVCLRVQPSETLRLAHKIWFENRVIAREIGLRAAAIIEECYSKKPTFFCGKSRRSILSGLFYLLGRLSGFPKSGREISEIVLCSEVTVTNSRRVWLDTFSDLFPGFRIEKEEYSGLNYRRTYFKGKLLSKRPSEPSDSVKLENICPKCGGWKMIKSKMCFNCYYKRTHENIPRSLLEAKAQRDKRLNKGKEICL